MSAAAAANTSALSAMRLTLVLLLATATGRVRACISQSEEVGETTLAWPVPLPPSPPPAPSSLTPPLSDLDTGQGRPVADDSAPSAVRYRLSAFGREMTLVLGWDREFAGPRVRVESVHRNFSEINVLASSTVKCMYKGTVEGDLESSVSVSICKGMTGTIRTGEGHYLIWPSEREEHVRTGAHVIQWYAAPTPAAAPRPVAGRRSRRSVSEPHFIEVLVAADSKMVDYHGDQLQQYILTLMSVVGQIYRDPSIGNSITISVVRIVRIDKEVLDTGKHHAWKYGKSASALLHRFCRWQQRMNGDDQGGTFDTAILLTRENICRNPRLERCDTLGLAELGTMCDPKASCSIIQDNGLSAAFTVAHELGHVLNIPHDDDFKCTEFMGPDKTEYAMSRMLNHNTHPWSWSNCSRHFLTDYLEGDYGRCLKNAPMAMPAPSALMMRPSGLRRSPTTRVTPRSRARYPGERYNASSQCQFLFGKQFQVCTYMPVCKRLWCTTGEEEAGCRTQHMPWADGTPCARGRWCIRGACVARKRRAKRVDGDWGNWGPWGSCSRTCGGGVRRSERQCDSPTPAHGGDYCLGQRVRYESCNRQDCPKDSIDFREAQCATFNGNNFNIKGLSNDVMWIPKYTGIKVKDRCKLFCRVSDSSAYYLLKDKVLDGTKCTPDTDHMCVSGTCRPAGCDHVLGSSMKSDLCGVCGGDNSTCRVIRSRYANGYVKYGYNPVVRIPAGATRLEVRQSGRRTDEGRDDNYLALKSPASGEFILNGNFVVSMFRKILQYGGVLVEYSGSDAVVERINCSKPIEEDLELYVLSVGNLVPPDVSYEYVVSVGEAETYRWQLADLWTDCNRVCNGVQYRRAECVRSSDLVRVAENHCRNAEKPDDRQMECNAHCELKWEVTHRSECSATCGPGVRKNVVRCFQKFPMYTMAPIGDQFCRHVEDRPADTEPCEGACSGAHWQFDQWSPCSKSCGGGSQRRAARCVSSEGDSAPEASCAASEKKVQRECGNVECPKWHTGNWTECSRTCGKGQQLRPLWCWQQDRVVDDGLCDMAAAPARARSCQQADCPHWRTLDWGKCSVTCGVGVELRSVDCVSSDAILSDFRCGNPRPVSSRGCARPACPIREGEPKVTTAPRWQNEESNAIENHRKNVWRWGRWSECSRRCGEGVRSRTVRCYDSVTNKALSEPSCAHVERPTTSERCQLRFCGTWNTTDWSACSSTCGLGLERRTVRCLAMDTLLPLEKDQCDSRKVPSGERTCQNEQPCTPADGGSADQPWVTGTWGECSTSCGGGLQQRLVFCRDGLDSAACKHQPMPNRTRPCHPEPCPRWQTSEWTECSVSCGSGTRQRQVRCVDRQGAVQSDAGCGGATSRPADATACRAVECAPATRASAAAPQPYSWRVSAWSKCSRSCGKGVQYRQVTCHRVNTLHWVPGGAAAAAAGGCHHQARPASARKCQRSCPQPYHWRPGVWTKCSQQCGKSGFKFRKVRCYSSAGRRAPRRNCRKTSRPRHKRRCNRRPCAATSCKDVRSRQLVGTEPRDGPYRLQLGGSFGSHNVTIYCYNMSGAEPLEYLTLPRHRGRRHLNYAEIDPKRLLQPETCPYNGSRVRSSRCDLCSRSRSPHAGMTVFRKVRLNITSLTIIPRDFRFARQLGGRPVGFGEAGDCYSSAGGCPQGRFKINLSGTGLRVASEVTWTGVGNHATAHVRKHKAGVIVYGRCGGLCATCRADSPDGIRLEPLPG